MFRFILWLEKMSAEKSNPSFSRKRKHPDIYDPGEFWLQSLYENNVSSKELAETTTCHESLETRITEEEANEAAAVVAAVFGNAVVSSIYSLFIIYFSFFFMMLNSRVNLNLFANTKLLALGLRTLMLIPQTM